MSRYYEQNVVHSTTRARATATLYAIRNITCCDVNDVRNTTEPHVPPLKSSPGIESEDEMRWGYRVETGTASSDEDETKNFSPYRVGVFSRDGEQKHAGPDDVLLAVSFPVFGHHHLLAPGPHAVQQAVLAELMFVVNALLLRLQSHNNKNNHRKTYAGRRTSAWVC